MSNFNNGSHDADITRAETPRALLLRLTGQMRRAAATVDTAIPLLDTIGDSDLEYLTEALANTCDELRDIAIDAGALLRSR
jgi:hypothetical protein